MLLGQFVEGLLQCFVISYQIRFLPKVEIYRYFMTLELCYTLFVVKLLLKNVAQFMCAGFYHQSLEFQEYSL